jgi:hypothetical protein
MDVVAINLSIIVATFFLGIVALIVSKIQLGQPDAPSGMDVGSQFARSALTFSNKLTRLATNRNARAGNIGCVLKGSVPACKAAYGYSYHRDVEMTSNGKILVKKAWWETNSKDAEGKVVSRSPADVVIQIFNWIGNEGHTAY